MQSSSKMQNSEVESRSTMFRHICLKSRLSFWKEEKEKRKGRRRRRKRKKKGKEDSSAYLTYQRAFTFTIQIFSTQLEMKGRSTMYVHVSNLKMMGGGGVVIYSISVRNIPEYTYEHRNWHIIYYIPTVLTYIKLISRNSEWNGRNKHYLLPYIHWMFSQVVIDHRSKSISIWSLLHE